MSGNNSKIWEEQIDQTYIIGISGRIDHTLAPSLETTLKQLATAGVQHFLIDLTAVNYINSGGLRCLLSAWRRARQQGGDVVLFGLNQRLKGLVETMGLNNVFRIYATKESALKQEQ